MSKASDVVAALIEQERDEWQCRTCSAPSDDDATRKGYCRNCANYWDDCDAGLFD